MALHPPARRLVVSRFHVFQDLYVVGVADTPTSLRVELRTASGNRHAVDYHFDPDQRGAHRQVLEGWQESATALTYVRRGREGVLLDDEAEFWHAYA